VPYAVTGVRGNERCLWVTAPPLPAREAVQASRAVYDDVDDAIQADALHILDSARLKGLDVVQLWLDEEERALADGYTAFASQGIRASSRRATGRRSWSTSRRIVTLCSCALAQCNDQQMNEVMHAHHCALERLEADWQVFAVPKFLEL
jgi:hypothetical protein